MKNKLIIICCLLALNVVGQQEGIGIIYESAENNIKLRWAPSNENLWTGIIEHGVTLSRQIYSIDGKILTPDDRKKSEKTLLKSQRPLEEGKWGDRYPGNQWAETANNILYSKETNPKFPNATLETAVETKEADKTKHSFSLIIADRDFDIAQGLALGYLDKEAKEKHVYQYKIEISNPDFKDYVGITLGSTIEEVILNNPQNIRAEGDDKLIKIYWNISSTKGDYNAYNIERSTDKVNWKQRNELPFFFTTGTGVSESTDAVFIDELDKNNIKYYYRIQGITPFGTVGPYSEMAESKGVDPRIKKLDVYAKIKEVTDNYASIAWSVSKNYENIVSHFDIFKSSTISGDYVKLNDTPLPYNKRDFQDFAPLYEGYYVVTMYDVNGHYYKSNAELAQMPDTTPPAIPTNISFVVDDSGRVDIDWDDNTEEDLSGYRIFRSNFRDREFMDINGQVEKESKFTEYLPMDILSDSIFYKVLASDLRGNMSEMSTIQAAARPNDLAPSNPLLQSVTTLQDANYIDWELSPSSDLVKHVLQRKPEHESSWVDLLVINKGEEEDYTENVLNDKIIYDFIDEDDLEPVTYLYRIMAYDNFGNSVSSEIKTVSTLRPTSYGDIQGISLEYVCNEEEDPFVEEQLTALEEAIQLIASGTLSTVVIQDLSNTGMITAEEFMSMTSQPTPVVVAFLNFKIDLLNEAPLKELCGVELNWSYDNQDQFKGFKIYRGKDHEDMIVWKFLKAEDLNFGDGGVWFFLDEEINENTNYGYQIMAEYLDGSQSTLSEIYTTITTIN